MSRKIHIVWAGRHQRKAWEELCADYRDRITRFLPVVDQPIKVREEGDATSRRRSEARAILGALPQPVWLIALDEKGEATSSAAFAERLGRLKSEWPHPIAFVLGSDVGLDAEVLAAARQTLSLGPMTLPHELARLLLYEQIYRALSLDAGINYHRA